MTQKFGALRNWTESKHDCTGRCVVLIFAAPVLPGQRPLGWVLPFNPRVDGSGTLPPDPPRPTGMPVSNGGANEARWPTGPTQDIGAAPPTPEADERVQRALELAHRESVGSSRTSRDLDPGQLVECRLRTYNVARGGWMLETVAGRSGLLEGGLARWRERGRKPEKVTLGYEGPGSDQLRLSMPQ